MVQLPRGVLGGQALTVVTVVTVTDIWLVQSYCCHEGKRRPSPTRAPEPGKRAANAASPFGLQPLEPPALAGRLAGPLAGPPPPTSPYHPCPDLPGSLQPTLQLVWWTPLQLALQLISPPARPASVPLARCLGGVAEDAEACDSGAHGRSGRPGPPFPFPIIVTVSFSSGLLLSSLLRTLSSSPQHHQHHQLVPPAPSLQHQNMTTSLILSVTIILQISIM